MLAGEASACFSRALDTHACFDARISQLPNAKLVQDYFRWRQEDAHRNALNAHCYWRLRDQGLSARRASTQLAGQSVAQKHEFLFAQGINFNDLPAWQKRGVGLHWRSETIAGHNPKTGASTEAVRQRLHCEMELPFGDAYGQWLQELLTAAG